MFHEIDVFIAFYAFIFSTGIQEIQNRGEIQILPSQKMKLSVCGNFFDFF